MDDFFALVMMLCLGVVAVAGYFLPSIIAVRRNHHNKTAIIVLNAALGWTLLGWVGSLVWSLTNPEPVTTTYVQQTTYAPPPAAPNPPKEKEPPSGDWGDSW